MSNNKTLSDSQLEALRKGRESRLNKIAARKAQLTENDEAEQNELSDGYVEPRKAKNKPTISEEQRLSLERARKKRSEMAKKVIRSRNRNQSKRNLKSQLEEKPNG